MRLQRTLWRMNVLGGRLGTAGVTCRPFTHHMHVMRYLYVSCLFPTLHGSTTMRIQYWGPKPHLFFWRIVSKMKGKMIVLFIPRFQTDQPIGHRISILSMWSESERVLIQWALSYLRWGIYYLCPEYKAVSSTAVLLPASSSLNGRKLRHQVTQTRSFERPSQTLTTYPTHLDHWEWLYAWLARLR